MLEHRRGWKAFSTGWRRFRDLDYRLEGLYRLTRQEGEKEGGNEELQREKEGPKFEKRGGKKEKPNIFTIPGIEKGTAAS